VMTGTSISNSPLAAFSQYELVEPGALGFSSFTAFKDHYASYVSTKRADGHSFPTLAEYKNLDELRDAMAKWSSVVLREDCDDMPPLVPSELVIEPTEAMRKAFYKLKEEMILELEGMSDQEITAIEGNARRIKLQQLMSGFVIDPDGNVRDVEPDERNPRLNGLQEYLEQTDGKTIIWCQFREDLKRVARRLKAMDLGFVEYHGVITSQEQRQQAIDRFMKDPRITVFLGQPQAGGAGLNLSSATSVVWYSHTHDAIIRNQANERATLIGGKAIGLVDVIVPGGPDETILQNHERKRAVADRVAGRGLRDMLIAEFKEMQI
jgi:SNF2 family DNA or RNA helicase